VLFAGKEAVSFQNNACTTILPVFLGCELTKTLCSY